MEKFKNSTKKIDNDEKISGKALFVDDILLKDYLNVLCVRAHFAHGKITKINLPSLPEGYYFINEKDVKGENITDNVYSDQPFFVKDGIVNFYGEVIGLLVGPNKQTLLDLESLITIEYEELSTNFELNDYKINKHFSKGDLNTAIKESDFCYEETFHTGYQEQVYLETQGIILYEENNQIVIKASMQCPFYIKKAVIRASNLKENEVRVIQPAVGGAFGGKEHYPSLLACQLVTAYLKVKKPLKLIFDRLEDLIYTTKRHPSEITYVGYVKNKHLIGVKAEIKLNGGAYVTCSEVVLSRSMIAALDCYTISNLDVTGRVCITNSVPSDAFRGFGSPQSIFAFEMFMEHIAQKMNVDPIEFRMSYLAKKGDITSTNGKYRDEIILPQLVKKAMEMSDFKNKYKEYKNSNVNKGIGMSVFLHGCGFTGSGESSIINAKVKLVKEKNNQVHLYTSQVDFGQGNKTTLKKIVSDTLNIPEDQVIHESPDTNHTLSTGPTAASRTIIIVGYLCEKAAINLKKIWKDNEYQEIIEPYVGPSYISWDDNTMIGDAYPGYAWGVNIIEIEFDPITYQVKVIGCWSTYDVGHAIDDRIVCGQADGGLAQGIGFAYFERMDMKNGQFNQRIFSDYTVPTFMDLPKMETALIDNPFIYGAKGAKGCGELTLVGAAPAMCQAIEMAIKRNINKIPANPEYLMELIENGKD